MKSKKILYIILLVILIIAIAIFIIITANRTERLDVSKSKPTSIGNNRTGEINSNGKKITEVTTLDDGILYSVTDKEIEPDIVIGDNYFDTQIADISLNISNYEGKTIEIEGMSLSNNPYKFVGRYSTASLCADCPVGYSYLEYEWNGERTPALKDEESWLKIKGTLKKGNDSGIDYCYIDVSSLEVMNKKGIETVNN